MFSEKFEDRQWSEQRNTWTTIKSGVNEREGIIQEGAGDTPGTWDKGGDTLNMGSPQNKTCIFTELWTKEAPPSPLDYGSLWW